MSIIILKIKTVEIREVQNLAQGHTASRQGNERETPVCVTLERCHGFDPLCRNME